jgi:hypothetical protein
MAALKALLFAIFGGFIGAAPSAPVHVAEQGHDGYADAHTHTQKRGRTVRDRISEGRPVAAAPPGPGFAQSAACPPRPPTPGPPPAQAVAEARGARGTWHCARPAADVRAGLVGLPPPAR